MPPTIEKRFSQYVPNEQVCVTEAEAEYVYKQVKLDRKLNLVQIQHESVCIINRSSENVWFHSNTKY